MNSSMAVLSGSGYFDKLAELYSGSNGTVLYILGLVLVAVIGYLLGSLNFGVIISKKKYHEDIRTHGSGNGGTTNMMRTYGKAAAVATLTCDMLKAVAAVFVGLVVSGTYGAYIGGLFCIIGHAFPCFFKFKGGKGVAVTAAVILCTQPLVFFVLLLMFVIVVAATKYISLGSILCMLMYPILLSNVQKIFGIGDENGRNLNVVFAFIMMCIVVWLHRENIMRLHNHTENKFSFRRSVKPAEEPKPEETPEESPASPEPRKSAQGKNKKKKK